MINIQSIKLIYYNNSLLDSIVKAIDSARNDVTNTALLEDRVFKRLARYIDGNYEKSRHTKTIMRMVHETIKQYKEDYKNERYQFFNEVFAREGEAGDKDEEYTLEPEDVLADVESEVIAKEMTVLLAQDDHRKKVILGNWINGNDNTSDIARLLAQTIGGNVEAHRKYIQRFRKECRDKLATAI